MIDLKKERDLIEKTALKNGFKLKQQPNGEMALNPYVFDFAEELLAEKQAEINKEREQATEYFIDCEYLKEEILQLKAKLAKHESDDVVLVPREPTDEIISHLEEFMAETILKDDDDFIELYKAVIEAGEIK